jgi:hypothetical protein
MTRIARVCMVAVLVVLAGSACNRKPRGKHYERQGGFSYDPPSDFEIAEFPGLKYRISRGPRVDGFAPNINVIDEKFPGTLDVYVDASAANLKKLFKGLKVVSRDELRTRDGETALRLVTTAEQGTMKLRQTYYFFDGGATKYVLTCSALADGGEAHDAMFEDSALTFRIH